MSKTLHVTVPKMTAEIFRQLATVAPMPFLKNNALVDLCEELGAENVPLFLADLANEIQSPIGMNVDLSSGSRTSFIPPQGWTAERLTGWIATRKDFLEQEFGDIASMSSGNIGRNQPCFCGSGRKFKRCHGAS